MKVWEAAFKTPKSGKLTWLKCRAKTIGEATDKLREYIGLSSNYNLYLGPSILK